MGRWKIAAAALVILLAGLRLAWDHYGPYDAPLFPPAAATWEERIARRIAVPPGWRFSVYATGLGTPRLMQLTDAGDLIVSGFWSDSLMLVKADRDGDGRSDGTTVLADHLQRPHGLLLEGGHLLVAEETRVVRYDFDGTALANRQVVLDGLPSGGEHSSRTLKRGPDGLLYLSLGSSCNVCIEDNPWRAVMLRFAEGQAPEVFASGLRNTVGFDWQPGTEALYGVDNGRDNLGDDSPDDEVNLLERGRHYGWPYVEGMGLVDPDFGAVAPQGLAATPPVHGLGAHRAPLSITFLRHQPDLRLNGTALVAEHGSWNRSSKVGYRIVQLHFDGGRIAETPFLAGCEENEDVICRPVAILEAGDGTIFVSDDYAGAIYRLRRTGTN